MTLTSTARSDPSRDAPQPALLRAIDEAMQIGLAVVDLQGRKIHVNPAMCRLVGWTAQELLGEMPPFTYWPASDVPRIQAVFDDALQGRIPAEGAIVHLLHRSGRRFPARIQVGPLTTGDRVAGWVATVTDVTESQAALAALTESEHRFQQLVNHIQEVFYVWDIERHSVLYVSPSCEHVFGRPSKALLDDASCFRELVEPSYRPVVDEARKRQALGQPTSVEYPIVRPDGSLRWIWDQGYPLADSGRGRVVGIAADVTRRRQAEEALHRQVHQLTEAEQLAGLGSCVLDVGSGTMGWSDGFRQLLRLPPTVPVGIRTALRPIARPGRRAVVMTLRRLAKDTIARQGETAADLMIGLRSGEWPERLIRLRACRHEQPAVGGARLIMTLQDVTERERMTADLERCRLHLEDLVMQRTRELADATRKADAASRAKSEFLANISHEIRTPMNAIIGLVHLLREHTPDPELQEGIRGIEVSANQLLDLVNDVLDLSKVEAGRLSLEEGEFDVRQLVADVVAVCRKSASAKGLTIQILVNEAVPTRLRGDRLRISQILLNLVTNAVKFTPRGRVELRVDPAPAADGHRNFRFQVQDTGIGIAAEDLPRLFEPFEQVGPRTTGRVTGSGLGLSISRRLVHLMGGRMDVRSQLGRGSVFSFDLPLSEPESPTGDARDTTRTVPAQPRAPLADVPDPQPPTLLQGRVLVVDDNRINRQVTCDILRRRGYAVDAAASGSEAIDRAADTAYDTILMDLRMPGIDGVTAARAIRQLPGNAHPVIIAMSGNVQFDQEDEWRHSGMDHFVAKPVRPRTLLATVEQSVQLAARRRTATQP